MDQIFPHFFSLSSSKCSGERIKIEFVFGASILVGFLFSLVFLFSIFRSTSSISLLISSISSNLPSSLNISFF